MEEAGTGANTWGENGLGLAWEQAGVQTERCAVLHGEAGESVLMDQEIEDSELIFFD